MLRCGYVRMRVKICVRIFQIWLACRHDEGLFYGRYLQLLFFMCGYFPWGLRGLYLIGWAGELILSL